MAAGLPLGGHCFHTTNPAETLRKKRPFRPIFWASGRVFGHHPELFDQEPSSAGVARTLPPLPKRLHSNFRVGDDPGAALIPGPAAYLGSDPSQGRGHAIPGLRIETWGTQFVAGAEVGHPPLTAAAAAAEEEEEEGTGGDDGDGALAEAVAVEAVEAAEAGQPAEVDQPAQVDHPEKLVLQRPSCRHSTANLRQSE
jgi:hypothetical protein